MSNLYSLSAKMIKNKFYTVLADINKKWFLGQATTSLDMKVLNKKSMRDFKDAIRVKITSGAKPGDFLGIDFPLLIVSSKVLEVWKPFEKLETYHVVVENRNIPFDYHGVVFLGRGGPFDPVKSKAVYSESLNDEGKPVVLKQQGMYFDNRQWDGSDLLTINDFPCLPIVTERVVKVMKEAEITNCRYTPLTKYGIYE